MPGSLGVETMVQAMIKSAPTWDIPASLRWRIKPGTKTSWKYRGQITPDIEEITIEIHIKEINSQDNHWEMVADGYLWKKNTRIYQVENLTLESY